MPFRRLHFHDDIEVGVNEHHPVVAMFGGQRITLPPNHLVVFWAAQPHGPIETTPGGWAYGIHLPLPWVLQWRLPPLLMRRLLAGEVLIDPPGDRPAADLELMKNWARLLEDDSKELRIGRAAWRPRPGCGAWRSIWRGGNRSPSDAKPLPHSRGTLGRFEQMATLVATHYREPLTIDDIAETVHMAPAYAMRVFRKFSGMTLHEFLMHHRVSHAQRLLATTDETIDNIAARAVSARPPASTPASASWSASRRRRTGVRSSRTGDERRAPGNGTATPTQGHRQMAMICKSSWQGGGSTVCR